MPKKIQLSKRVCQIMADGKKWDAQVRLNEQKNRPESNYPFANRAMRRKMTRKNNKGQRLGTRGQNETEMERRYGPMKALIEALGFHS